MMNNRRRCKEKLVVEVAAAHNLMPKDGEGSSSAFVEVKFENQTRRTQVKHRDLNPVWNESLVFSLNDLAGLPYRTVEVNVFNERKSNSTRNFLGRVWVSGATVAREGEAAAQIFTLEKRTVFSHVRGEISLKLYVSTMEKEGEEEVKQAVNAGAGGAVVSSAATPKSKKNKKVQENNMVLQARQENNPNPAKQVEPSQPVVVTSFPGAAGRGGEMVGAYSAAGRNTSSPQLGGGLTLKLDKKTSSTYDLVEQMQYLYIKVVKARFEFAGGEVVAEVKLGNCRGITKKASAILPVWDQVFAFSKDSIQSSFVEIYVRGINRDDFLGRVWFDLTEIPRRVPPDSQLAPQWYRMEGKTGDDKSKAGEVMVSAWFGTQADEAFAEAWHSKSANVGSDGLSSIRSKVYLSPKLWYLRVGVLEAQDIVVSSCDKGSSLLRYPDLFVKVQVGNQVLRTRVSKTFSWNEDLMFVVGEPFEDLVFVSVEDRVTPHKDEVVGRLVLPVSGIERRANEKPVAPRWFNLDTNFNNKNQGGISKSVRFAPRIHLRASLDGGYHVLDESTVYSSDLRPTAKQFWKSRVGVLEVGFLGASDLVPMKMKQGTRGSTDSYCVAKYGQKWIRTRTEVDSLAPKWNEQYTWEVFDPCTVITIAVFDNSRVLNSSTVTVPDPRIGKVRIRLSTLETDRVYPLTYPLLMLHPSGVKKMGELSLAVRFSCDNNMVNMLHMYTLPLLPKMHYVQPLTVSQLDGLRYQAMNVVAGRLSRAEPPLGREVVEYMLDHDSQMWSMRKSKANFFRLTNVLTWAINTCRWFESVRDWNRPVYSAGFSIAFFVAILVPELVTPSVFLFTAAVGMWRYRWRPRAPPHADTRMSCAETVDPDELDEEFDFFPSARGPEVVRMRYDRLRSVAGRVQTVAGDVAMQAERFQALLSWRDPRATFLFVVFCFVAALGCYVVPFRLVVAAWGVYWLRPPRFRNRLPSCAVSFFKRLPTRADSLLL